jgi:hypothetical protein
MAHHSGMTLLALAASLMGRLMERRFLNHAPCAAHDLLLQERTPKAIRPVALEKIGSAVSIETGSRIRFGQREAKRLPEAETPHQLGHAVINLAER